MHIQGIFVKIVDNLLQLSIAVTIILLQRWLLELSTFEKDIAWLKKQDIYWLWKHAHWYRGRELVHQWRAMKLLKSVDKP